jgi:hypothetical protein
MSEKVINAGDEVVSYCPTCKDMVPHKVVNVVDGTPDKAICQGCGKRHKYRPKPPKSATKKAKKRTEEPSGTKKKRATKTSSSRTQKSKEPVLSWEEVLGGRDLSSAKTYTMDGIFEKDDLLDHDKFGYGIVTEIVAEGKMKVRFQSGEKLMVYGRETINA